MLPVPQGQDADGRNGNGRGGVMVVVTPLRRLR